MSASRFGYKRSQSSHYRYLAPCLPKGEEQEQARSCSYRQAAHAVQSSRYAARKGSGMKVFIFYLLYVTLCSSTSLLILYFLYYPETSIFSLVPKNISQSKHIYLNPCLCHFILLSLPTLQLVYLPNDPFIHVSFLMCLCVLLYNKMLNNFPSFQLPDLYNTNTYTLAKSPQRPQSTHHLTKFHQHAINKVGKKKWNHGSNMAARCVQTRCNTLHLHSGQENACEAARKRLAVIYSSRSTPSF